MMFNDRIKQLREDRQIPQQKLAAALDIDTASYCKIERGGRHTKRLKTDKDELLALWLADQVTAVVEDEYMVADKALSIAKKNISG